jgi:hypothetical protein
MEWLLDSDPAIHWQALRDLAEAPPELIAAERARVATDGWGARLLDLQGDDGQWEGGALFPARWFETPTSRSRTAMAGRAGGTRCGRCGSCAGTTPDAQACRTPRHGASTSP